MNVFVTGTDGYLGCLMAPELTKAGHQVTGLDTGFYKEGVLYRSGQNTPRTLVRDLRQLEPRDLQGFDAVVHMAELSNDPLGQLSPTITYQINHQGSLHLADLARRAGVPRFVYMSSCSVYGVSDAEFVDETSKVDPQTVYAECKTLVERDLAKLADRAFSPVFMRNATAYGASPRMRFDIVLNNLSGLAWTTKEIKMTSDGTPWRPLVHGLDICQAVVETLKAPREAVHTEVFNVGDTAHNYRVKEIAETVAKEFPGCKLTFGPPSADNRSYRVSFEKIRKHLPGFKCKWDAAQLHEVFKRIEMSSETFRNRPFTRLRQLEYLIKSGQLDPNFFWTESCAS